MPTRPEKHLAIIAHSENLFALASSYRKMATIAHVSSEAMVDILYRMKLSHDEINEEFTRELTEIMKPECERYGQITWESTDETLRSRFNHLP